MSETQITDTFDFELVSPERKLMSEKAWQVTVPGEEGNFGVRAGHSSLVSSIRPGLVEIVSNQGDAPTKIFIAGGFADVTASNCTILAEEALKFEELDRVEIEKEVSGLENKLSETKDDIETARYTKQLDLAKAKLTAVTGALAA
ncbi:MAG: ATP synthase F1 subunit epsilon [Micavibrio sp.]|nr:ATP synthase F1 subunit epsilon [Micavibrio sp.]|tara:strand:+ start:436 stop:870 length:435 start_codon:yes stop_codon:yes gene_type:complete